MSNLRTIKKSVNPPPKGDSDRSPRSITWGPDFSGSLFNSFDSLHLGLHVLWPEHHFFFEGLDEGKQEALEEDKPVPFNIGQADYVIYPTGRSGGYRWHLKSGDIHLFFSIRNPTGDTPNVFVEIGSMPCWSPGHQEVVEAIIDQLQEVGGSILKIRVSRVDLCADCIGLPFLKTGLHKRKLWIKQARNFGLRGSGINYNSMDIGLGGRIAFRSYDKRNELKNNPAKESFFNEIWELDDEKTPVTRVEFEIKKKALKEFKIETYKDLLEKLPGLWDYLTNKWFRLAEKPVNRTHQQEAKISSFWKIIQKVKWSGIKQKLKRIRKPRRSIDMLLDQAAGIALSVGVIEKYDKKDLDRFIYFFQGMIELKLKRMALKKKDFRKRIERKYAEIWTTERICPA